MIHKRKKQGWVKPKAPARAEPKLQFAPSLERWLGKTAAIATVAEYVSFLVNFNSVEKVMFAQAFGDGTVWGAPKMKALLTKGIELCDANDGAVRQWLEVVVRLSPDEDLRNAAEKRLAEIA